MTVNDYLPFSEYKKLVQNVDNKRDSLLLRLLWGTGARITEVLRIRAKDVIDGKIRIYNLKRKAFKEKYAKDNWRYTHPSDRTYELTTIYIENRDITPDETLFTITRQRAWQIVQSLSRKYNIRSALGKQVHPHLFRHGRGSKMAKEGTPIAVIAKNLGHKDYDTTYDYYIGFVEGEGVKAEAVE